MPKKIAGTIIKAAANDAAIAVGHLRDRDFPAFVQFFWKHQLLRYLFVGGSTFLIDFSLLVIGREKFRLSVSVAASISYWISIVYNFSLNRFWTFSQKELSALHKHALFYGMLLAFNYVFTISFIHFTASLLHYGPAKVLAVAIQMSWTYYLYKTRIFKSHIPPA